MLKLKGPDFISHNIATTALQVFIPGYTKHAIGNEYRLEFHSQIRSSALRTPTPRSVGSEAGRQHVQHCPGRKSEIRQ